MSLRPTWSTESVPGQPERNPVSDTDGGGALKVGRVLIFKERVLWGPSLIPWGLTFLGCPHSLKDPFSGALDLL